MSQQTLYLLNRHPFINRFGRQCPPKFMGMHFINPQFLSQISQANLHAADFQPVVGLLQGNEQRLIGILPTLQIIFQMNLCPCVKVDRPLLISLPKNNALPLFEINIFDI